MVLNFKGKTRPRKCNSGRRSVKGLQQLFQIRGAPQETADGKNNGRAYEMSESHRAPKVKNKPLLAEALNAGVWVK